MSSENEPTHAVVLSGGGASGAYEVGVLKALLGGLSPATGKAAVAPMIFAGTSIGAYNAAFLVSWWDTDGATAAGNLEKAWLEKLAHNPPRYGNGVLRFRGDALELLAPGAYLPHPLRPLLRAAEDGAGLAWEGLQRLVYLLFSRENGLQQRAADLLDFTAFVSTEPWAATIGETIDFARIRRSTRLVRIAATNWTTGDRKVFKNVDLTDKVGPIAIRASSAIPGVFPPVAVGAEPHVDGAIVMNTPLLLAIKAHADEIRRGRLPDSELILHAVYLDPAISAIPLSALRSTLGALARQSSIAWSQKLNHDIEDARAINRGLAIFRRLRAGEQEPSDRDLRDFVKVVSAIAERAERRLPYRPLTIHRFHPRDDLAGGSLGALNLDRGHIEDLIARGFSDARTHDCEAAGCVQRDGSGTRLDSERGSPR